MQKKLDINVEINNLMSILRESAVFDIFFIRDSDEQKKAKVDNIFKTLVDQTEKTKDDFFLALPVIEISKLPKEKLHILLYSAIDVGDDYIFNNILSLYAPDQNEALMLACKYNIRAMVTSLPGVLNNIYKNNLLTEQLFIQLKLLPCNLEVMYDLLRFISSLDLNSQSHLYAEALKIIMSGFSHLQIMNNIIVHFINRKVLKNKKTITPNENILGILLELYFDKNKQGYNERFITDAVDSLLKMRDFRLNKYLNLLDYYTETKKLNAVALLEKN